MRETIEAVQVTLPGRSWAPEIFVGADALLSGLKQVHVEAGDALVLLARELPDAGRGHYAELTAAQRAAVVRTTCAILEEAVDGVAFFYSVLSALHVGGALAAGAARILISMNTWTPQKRKHLSPFRLLDGTLTTLWLGDVRPAAQAHGLATAAWHRSHAAAPSTGSLTCDGVAWVLRETGAECLLATLFGHYARRAGFEGQSRRHDRTRRTPPSAPGRHLALLPA